MNPPGPPGAGTNVCGAWLHGVRATNFVRTTTGPGARGPTAAPHEAPHSIR